MAILGLVAVAVFIASLVYALFGGKSGVISTELNFLGHACLAAWALIVCVGAILSFRYSSNAVTGMFDLIESRKRHRWKWIRKGLVFVPIAVAVAWLAGYESLSHINSYLSGPVSRHAAEIARPTRYRSSKSGCISIEVRTQNDANLDFCVRRRPFGEMVPGNAQCARTGDRAEIAETGTALGKTMTLVSIEATNC